MQAATVPDPLVDALYKLIRTGELAPGERVDQRVISERLRVSRTPLREALRAMAADGVLTRTPNAGYAVAKLSANDLLQYYSIRSYLETQVLKSIPLPDQAQLDELKAINDDCREAASSGAMEKLIEANRRFHFTMLQLSPLRIMNNEIERIWRVSEPYRILHLSNPERRRRVSEDHDRMIEALERNDVPQLVELMDRHRSTSRQILSDMLGPSLVSPFVELPQAASELSAPG